MNKKPGQRMSVQRRVILEELRKVKSHPTADELYQIVRRKLPRVSLGTVYRNLELLTGNGDVTRIDTGDQRRYDGNTHTHFHARCLQCGRLVDLPDQQAERIALPELGQAGNFEITGITLEFQGICHSCRNDGN